VQRGGSTRRKGDEEVVGYLNPGGAISNYELNMVVFCGIQVVWCEMEGPGSTAERPESERFGAPFGECWFKSHPKMNLLIVDSPFDFD